MPSLDFSQAPPWLQWLLAVAAVIGFIVGAIRGIPPAWRFVTRFVGTVNNLAELPVELAAMKTFREETKLTLAQQNVTLAKQNATLASQDQKIAEIHHETHFNNGSSIKDATVRIEEGVKGLYGEIVDLKQEDADLRSDFEKTQPKHPTQGDTTDE
jgi:hypothetical protein